MQADWQNEAKASVAKVNYLCSQESSWKCRLHVWTCEHERREGQSLHKNQGLAGVKGHISCIECKEARGRIPVYQENEIKSLNCGQEKSHRV